MSYLLGHEWFGLAETESKGIGQLVLKMSLLTLCIIFLFFSFSSLILSSLVVHSFFKLEIVLLWA